MNISDFIVGLLSIIMMDIVLGGDNAIVISMACRNLPKNQRMKGIMIGTAGAVVLRVAATIGVAWLLDIKGLMLGGGILLFFIGYKLIIQKDTKNEEKVVDTLGKAILTIIVADITMSVDNILAVAGAAHGNIVLLIIGLCVSIPIMVFCSTLILKLMDRFPIVLYIGGALILYTAYKMILDEPLAEPFFERFPFVKYIMIAGNIAAVILVAIRNRRIAGRANAAEHSKK
ncbi:MAG: TerC family protein [Clostridiales Family XIII bacterium]|jgi:YjbE family integral membrane protein|nr:TerC family protein [Clostridiales Family XIII bacterium]